MFQNGTDMIDATTGRVSFDNNLGKNALSFYTQFAKSGSPYYSWTPRMHYSVDAFSEGNLAMMFNYSWQIATIKSKSPKLNFDVAEVPQFSSGPRVNFANY
jgi:ABC-type glycerol-3-phosphate transport system substrate-binding protein